VADEIAETLTVSAGAEIPTTFMALFGMDSLSVSAEAEVTRRMTALDLVLAIDMSGSMRNSASGGGSRISAARTAAKDLVDILFGSHAAKDFLNVGVVPWSAKVNVTLDGSDYYHWENRAEPSPTFVNPLTGAVQSQVWYASNSPVPFLSEPDDDWDGCVYNRYTDDGVDTNDADMLMGATTAGTTDWPAYEPVGPEGEPVSGWGRCTLAVDGNECQRCLSEGITPLTNQKSQVIAAIDSLTSPNGTTNIPLGLAWGWEVVSPEAPFDQAVADPDYDRVQAIVLLTDGENYAGSGDGYKGVWGLGYRGNDEMNERLLLVADSIKASGVEIYAIQFANGSGALANLMRDVASEEGSPYYHYAPDRDALRSVFREVANHLSELRLSR
ncbi:MAG: VWA domain-containing protein, partial [Rhodospirillaceae bacterium]